MSSMPSLTRLAAAAARSGGAVWCLFWLWHSITHVELYPARMDLLSVLAVAAALLAGGLCSLYAAAHSRLGWPAKAGLGAAFAGKGLFALGALIAAVAWPPAYGIAILSELVTTLGLLLFAVSNLPDRMFSRWSGLPLLLALVYPPSWMLDPGSLPATLRSAPDLLAALYGLGWVALGFRLWANDGGPTRARSRP